jgi:hypothetical protein
MRKRCVEYATLDLWSPLVLMLGYWFRSTERVTDSDGDSYETVWEGREWRGRRLLTFASREYIPAKGK